MAGAPGTGHPKSTSEAEQKQCLLTALKKHLSDKEHNGRLTINKMPEITEPTGEWEFGKAKANKSNKVIMMLGETGSGKTSLINTMINYIFGVEWKDDHRIQLIAESSKKSQAHSQTSVITAYQINHEDGLRIPYSITIIDTPGFGDTRGIKYDMETMRQIEVFFSKCKFQAIDAICFVVKSSQTRLTVTQKYIFDNVLSIFAKDIKENIIFFTTFADPQIPTILSPINEAGIPCARSQDGVPVYFKINNGMTYVNNDPEQDEDTYLINGIQWKKGMKSIEDFFSWFLPGVISIDLRETKDVLKERIGLEVTLEGLILRIEERTCQQHLLEEAEKILEKYKEDIKNYSDFVIEVTEMVRKKIESEERSINCHKCDKTCHKHCPLYFPYIVYLCEVFAFFGTCRKCGCDKSEHFFENYYWEDVYERQRKTVHNILEKYQKASKNAMTYKETLKNLKSEIEKSEKEGEKLIQEIIRSLKRLQEIALKPKPMSAAEYIDLLIEAEKREGKEGCVEKIKMLEKTKNKCEILSKIEMQPADVKFDPKVLKSK